MGNLATPEALIARWNELCRDPALQDLPCKIELNAWGKIEMSPASNWHALLRGSLAGQFDRKLAGGAVLTECSVLTTIGVRCPDVAWASKEFLARHGASTPYTRAPDICVEILSPSNVQAEMAEQSRAYLDSGAKEVWAVSETRKIRYFDRLGEKTRSRFRIRVTLPAPPREKP